MSIVQGKPAPLSRGTVVWIWRWFWRLALILGLASAWYCFYVPSNSVAWASNYTHAQAQATQSDKPIILFFTGQWCVPCRIMKRTVWADEQVAASVNTRFVPVAIQVDSPDDADVLSRYKVAGALGSCTFHPAEVDWAESSTSRKRDEHSSSSRPNNRRISWNVAR